MDMHGLLPEAMVHTVASGSGMVLPLELAMATQDFAFIIIIS